MENKNNNEIDKPYDNGFRPREVSLKENYKFYPTNICFVLFSKIIVFISVIFEFISKKLIYGYKVVGKKNFRKHPNGNFIICNHVLPKDVFMLITSLFPKKVYVTSLQSNLGFPLVSAYFRIAALVPIPEDRRLLKKFKEETLKTIQAGKNIVFFAEGSLVPYCDHIRDFKSGAFHFAYESNATIIPMVYTFHRPKGLYKLYKKKPCPRLNILPPYTIKEHGTRKETIDNSCKEVWNIINDYFQKNNEFFDGTYQSIKI